MPRSYVHHVIAPGLFNMKGSRTEPFYKNLFNACILFLDTRKQNKPEAPENMVRELPHSISPKSNLQQLKNFMASPTEFVFDYKQPELIRRAMENAIQNAALDLQMQTIKRGLPHTLRITKNNKSFLKKLGQWEKDMELLQSLLIIERMRD